MQPTLLRKGVLYNIFSLRALSLPRNINSVTISSAVHIFNDSFIQYFLKIIYAMSRIWVRRKTTEEKKRACWKGTLGKDAINFSCPNSWLQGTERSCFSSETIQRLWIQLSLNYTFFFKIFLHLTMISQSQSTLFYENLFLLLPIGHGSPCLYHRHSIFHLSQPRGSVLLFFSVPTVTALFQTAD